MSNIVDFSALQSHEVQEVMCWKCGERWIAVYPEKTLLKSLECPNCGESGYVFGTNQSVKVEGE